MLGCAQLCFAGDSIMYPRVVDAHNHQAIQGLHPETTVVVGAVVRAQGYNARPQQICATHTPWSRKTPRKKID